MIRLEEERCRDCAASSRQPGVWTPQGLVAWRWTALVLQSKHEATCTVNAYAAPGGAPKYQQLKRLSNPRGLSDLAHALLDQHTAGKLKLFT